MKKTVTTSERTVTAMVRKKIITAVISIVLALGASAAAVAAINTLASKTEGSTESYIVNRVNMTFDNTDFTFENVNKGDTLTCKAHFSIEKTEPDFYGVLNSFAVQGVALKNVVFTAGKGNGTALFPSAQVLPTVNGKTSALEWDVSFSFVWDGSASEYKLSANADYTTGVTQETAQRFITSIPITIKVNQ